MTCLNDSCSTVAGYLSKSFIWAAPYEVRPNDYVLFRKTIRLPAPAEKAIVHIFADSRYALFINGKLVGGGPARFDPQFPEYDSLEITPYLKPGENLIAVLGRCFGSVIALGITHPPGLTLFAQIDLQDRQRVVFSSDPTWKTSRDTPWISGTPARWSWASEWSDARHPVADWFSPEFDDHDWQAALPVDGNRWGIFRSRSIPLLETFPAQGLPRLVLDKDVSFSYDAKSKQTDPRTQTTIQTETGMLDKCGPLHMADGSHVVVDMDYPVLGRPAIRLTAQAGVELRVDYFEHLRAGDLTVMVENTSCDRYICRTGEQTWFPIDSRGFRYLVIEVRNGPAVIHAIEAVNIRYPVRRAGKFECSDQALNEIWKMCALTTELCMEDAYLDTINRERCLWQADTVGPAFHSNLAAFGDVKLYRRLLWMMPQSQDQEGRLKAHVPSDWREGDPHEHIEDYMLLELIGLQEYYHLTDDDSVIREVWPGMVKMLAWFERNRTGRGLLQLREFIFFANPTAYKVGEGTTLNAMYVAALRAAAELASLVGDAGNARHYAQLAEAVQTALHRYLWNAETGTYDALLLPDGSRMGPTKHAAFIALWSDVVPSEHRESVYDWLTEENGLLGLSIFPYTTYYLLDVLCHIGNSATADRLMLDLIRWKWAPLLEMDTRTTPEDFYGGAWVHEAGTAPAWFLSSFVLGVRVERLNGKRTLLVQPRLTDLEWAEGVVPSVLGDVQVSHSQDGERWRSEVILPQGQSATCQVPREGNSAEVSLDGTKVSVTATADGRFWELMLHGGAHVIEVWR
ncbi:MAG: family 78 glycoside hydrolase catalytic domain [Candidatus Latescibacterota bacterium]